MKKRIKKRRFEKIKCEWCSRTFSGPRGAQAHGSHMRVHADIASGNPKKEKNKLSVLALGPVPIDVAIRTVLESMTVAKANHHSRIQDLEGASRVLSNELKSIEGKK